MRARAVADGEPVEIPALRMFRTVGTQKDSGTGERKNPGKAEVMRGRQNPSDKAKADAERRIVTKLTNPYCREKPL